MTHPVPYPESSSTPSHMHMASMKNCHLCSINDHFSKTKSFCFINKNSLDKLRYSLVFTKSCVFLWEENFRGLTTSFASLSTLSRTFIVGYICLTKNTGFFYPMGYLSLLAIPNTRIFHFLFIFCNRETHFARYPILPSPPSNTKHSVNLPCTHDIPSNTKHNVDLYHALTPMSCNVPFINSMQFHIMYLMLHAQ